jgi:PRC-barrel domain
VKPLKTIIVSTCLFSLSFSAALADQPSSARMVAQLETAPPVAGQVSLGVTVDQMQALVTGWSAKKDFLGKAVRNEKGEKLGTIEDVIVTPKDSISYAIIGVGGFLGINERRIAVPLGELARHNDQFELPGATKDVITAMPPFVYSH